MGRFSKNWWVTLTILLAISGSLIKLSEARAKASFWGDSDEESEDDFFASKEKKDAAPATNVVRAAGLAGMAQDPHENHPASHHVHNNPNEPKQNWNGGEGGLQSGSFAAHNESCSPTTKSCIPRANMECSSTDGAGRCACIIGWVYVRDTESCWQIPKSNHDTCAHDVQCKAGKWGEKSRCNKHETKCECHDWTGKREMVQAEDGVCYIKKSVGDLCDTHEECDKPIAGDAYCQYGDHDSAGGHRYNGSCQCKETHSWYKPLNSCLMKSTKLGDDCVVSQQCREGSLGKWSKCNTDTAKCDCWSFGGVENKTEVVYYERLKKCFLKKEYNDTCDEDDQCRANLGPDVVCGPTDDYPDTDVCHCPKGKTCRSSAFSIMTGGKSLTTVGLACAAAVTAIGLTMRMGGVISGVGLENRG